MALDTMLLSCMGRRGMAVPRWPSRTHLCMSHDLHAQQPGQQCMPAPADTLCGSCSARPLSHMPICRRCRRGACQPPQPQGHRSVAAAAQLGSPAPQQSSVHRWPPRCRWIAAASPAVHTACGSWLCIVPAADLAMAVASAQACQVVALQSIGVGCRGACVSSLPCSRDSPCPLQAQRACSSRTDSQAARHLSSPNSEGSSPSAPAASQCDRPRLRFRP